MPVGWALAHADLCVAIGQKAILLDSAHREYFPAVEISLCVSVCEAWVDFPSGEKFRMGQGPSYELWRIPQV